MLFSSVTFLFLFLPIVISVYYCLPRAWRNTFLLLASFVFYGWDNPKLLPLLLSVILINYIGAIILDKIRRFRQLWFVFFILCDVGILTYFKYANFLVQVLNEISSAHYNIDRIVLPIGVSFYIFQAISYLSDVYRKVQKVQYNPVNFALYVAFFPQLIAGPIIQYNEISWQITHRRENLTCFYHGIRRFIIGLAKKVLIGNVLGVTVHLILNADVKDLNSSTAWYGMLLFIFQLYYDFSGYSDMAIGLGYMFGFKIPENFNYPFVSKSFSEFWRRWHMSLGRWCKQYIYIPLGGNRCSKTRMYFNLFMTLFVIGIWHGASWNILIYAVLCGTVVTAERILGIDAQTNSKIINFIKHIYFVVIFILVFVFFKSPKLEHALSYMQVMFGLLNTNNVTHYVGEYVNNIQLISFAIAVLCALPIKINVLRMNGIWKNAVVNVWLLCLFILSVMAILTTSYNPFIYFRF